MHSTRTANLSVCHAEFLHFLSGSSKCGVALDLRRVLYNFPNDVYVPECSVLRSMHAYAHGIMCDNPGTRTGSPLWARAQFLHFLSGSSKCGVALDLRRVMYNFPNDVYVPQCSVLRSMHAYSHGLMCDNPGTRTGSPLWAHARTQRHR